MTERPTPAAEKAGLDAKGLLPCPFCGSSKVRIDFRCGVHKGQCLTCRAEGPVADTAPSASEAWNRRAPDGRCEAGKVTLDAAGLKAAYKAHQDTWTFDPNTRFEAGIRAYLAATPDAQYRRGAEDMREAAAKRADEFEAAVAELPLAKMGCPLRAGLYGETIRTLPITDHQPTPDEGKRS